MKSEFPNLNAPHHKNFVTPKYDITWYVKWAVSCILLFGVAIGPRGAGIVGWEWVDLVCSWIGALGWWWVGYKWNDRAMQLVNGVFLFVLTIGLFRFIFE
jgi:hypothetical protein